ncbi:MAG: class I SAM-dependent methyltransferase [Defluviitaleaceae bacterium]|nr:class I SAM-dependent methyltransferase [Defluviitaleaceae bacterium]
MKLGMPDHDFGKMENHLEVIAKSYDRSVDLGRKGIDIYTNLPEYITNDPDYSTFQKCRAEGDDSSSGRKDIRDYLSPATDMKFIDLGCCLNLMFNGYDNWPSLYHGVDISNETINLLHEFIAKKNLHIGSLFCGSVHKTPFEDSSFDIGACIGVFEYFKRSFVEKVLIEAYRIMKPCGQFVLDAPNNENSMRRFMNLIEEYMGRPVRFDISPHEFEDILQNYFDIDKKDELNDVAMIQYFLRRKK